jgi:peptidylprolyl isomerase
LRIRLWRECGEIFRLSASPDSQVPDRESYGLQWRLNLLSSRPRRSSRPLSEGEFMFACSRRAALWLPLLAVSAAWAAEDPENTVVLTTKHGKVVIRLRPDWAPKHVAQIKSLVQSKFYDGIVFHRVIPGFMAQTGDPTGTGTGGSSLPNLPAEFNKTHFTRGILGMARSEDPDSANSQFFITTADAGFLDGKYTAFGEVVSGMDVVDKIKAGTQDNNGMVTNPDKIVTMRMASAGK